MLHISDCILWNQMHESYTHKRVFQMTHKAEYVYYQKVALNPIPIRGGPFCHPLSLNLKFRVLNGEVTPETSPQYSLGLLWVNGTWVERAECRDDGDPRHLV